MTSFSSRQSRYTRLPGTRPVVRALAQSIVVLLFALVLPLASRSQPSQPGDVEKETPWPHDIVSGDLTLRVYQPQLDSWNGSLLQARAAVSATQGQGATPTYGIVHLQARTLVDKQQRIVTLDDLNVTRAEFPSAPDKADEWARLIEADAAQKKRTVALDRLEAALEITAASATTTETSVRNPSPRIIFSTKPAMLIYVDGEPVFRDVPNTAYQRLVNTRALIVRNRGGQYFLKIFDGWMSASQLTGPWSVAASPPADLETVLKTAVDARQVDLLTGRTDPDEPGPSLAKGPVPAIHIATSPTELVVTDGEPKWVPIPGTQLLYAENTTGNLFKLVSDQSTYVLASGRWFRAPGTQGPWTFVPANKLPADFADIPDDSPKENVKASIAGTPQAKEAAVAATIPETAAVQKSTAKLTPPVFDGEPKLQPIEGTTLQYVVNCPTPIIRVNDHSFYAVENGVWFTATSVRGPWTVATSVPAVIYAIPASSPLHYVTYVKIYDVQDDTVYVGYTPGYEGEYVDPVTHVVVYGTGYDYAPWVGTVWYGPPVTYGFGVAMRYTPWTGWAVGFGFGWSWGPATVAVGWGWGPYPWWGPFGWGWSWGPPVYAIYPVPYWRHAAVGPHGASAWGPGGWVGTTGNVYRRWGPVASVSRTSVSYNPWTGNAWARQAGLAYNSRTGTITAGQRGAVTNVYTGRQATAQRGATTRGGEFYAGQDGNVYRRTDAGWQQAQRPEHAERAPERMPETERVERSPEQTHQQLERDYSARSRGSEMYAGRQQSTRSMPSRGGGRRR